MKYLTTIKLIAVSAILFLSAVTMEGQHGSTIPSKPKVERLVNDFADILSPEQEKALEDTLDKFARKTSTQIAVVTIKDLGGMDPYQYAFEILDKWGIGQRGKDNGVVMLIKPKLSKNDRGHIAIQVGYGLEGVLPDATVKLIIDKAIIPYFKKGDFYGGIMNGVIVIKKLAAGEFTADDIKKTTDEGNDWVGLTFIIFLFILIFVFGRGKKGGGGGGGFRRSSSIFWGASSGGFFNDFSSGGGSFGGFGGFGGGTGGGGGASGSW